MASDDEDNRVECKYGASCYQKNPAHLAKFKHPEKRKRSKSPDKIPKKQKNENFDIPETQTEPEKQINDIIVDIADDEDRLNANSSDTSNVDEDINQLSLETLEDRKKFIKQKCLVEMPEDFFLFWDLCKELNKQNPKEAFKSVGLVLVGPYDILNESFKSSNLSWDQKFFLHWRYYYDPPEFQTIIKGDGTTGYHIGYFRDSPDEKPAFVAYNEANKNCTITQIGMNVFGAVNTYLEKLLKTGDPFKKITVTKLQKVVNNKANELKLPVHSRGKPRKTVCKSFHTAGIVVPYDRRTELGYRPLPVNEEELKKLLNQVAKASVVSENAFTSIQPIVTAATIANDECDFGTALELGINMFCFGHKCFNNTVLNLLKVTYALLNRQAFAQIIEEHLKHREKENPYIINLNK